MKKNQNSQVQLSYKVGENFINATYNVPTTIAKYQQDLISSQTATPEYNDSLRKMAEAFSFNQFKIVGGIIKTDAAGNVLEITNYKNNKPVKNYQFDLPVAKIETPKPAFAIVN